MEARGFILAAPVALALGFDGSPLELARLCRAIHQIDRTACRDEAAFPAAGVVDFRRDPNRHVGFGAGVHRCRGESL